MSQLLAALLGFVLGLLAFWGSVGLLLWWRSRR